MNGKGGGLAVAALFLCAGCVAETADPVAGGAPTYPVSPETGREVPPPPRPEGVQIGDRVYPSGGYLQTMYGISDEEAARRLFNEELIGQLNTSLYENPVQGFSSLWIRHEPTYAVVVNVSPPFDRDAILARADETIRDDIEFVSVTRTQSEISRTEDRIIVAWRDIRDPWSGGYEVQTDRFRYTAGAPATLEAMRAALPADLRDEVVLEIGSQPEPLLRR